ncbi:MAG: type II toxin-antitoxin system RelE/ParE family toxin [Deltaproteobacteria bacterium]|nr:type II toxin-antitoxin system RelE/ParE family toxin [Deltaproteobacteria bacterium]
MALYKVAWKSSAERELKRIDKQFIPKIFSAVESLVENPFPSQCRRLQGVESVYRLRIGDYRVVYQVDTTESTITIYHVRHRKEAYRR